MDLRFNFDHTTNIIDVSSIMHQAGNIPRVDFYYARSSRARSLESLPAERQV